jgi:hypothetical protein
MATEGFKLQKLKGGANMAINAWHLYFVVSFDQHTASYRFPLSLDPLS